MAPEIVAFILKQPADWGYGRLAGACRATFGAGAPDAAAIRAWWIASGRAVLPRDRISRDPEVADFVRDLAGRLPGDDILAALRERFPAKRLPSRSALYRFLERETRPPAAARQRAKGGRGRRKAPV